MAASPKLKVFDKNGEYVGSLHHAEDAGAVVALYGDGASIRSGHSKKCTVWLEGSERQPAGESFDVVADVVARRQEYLRNFGGDGLAFAMGKPNDRRPREVQS